MRCPSSALPTSKCRRPRSGSGARFKVNHRGTEVTEKKTSKFSVTSVPLWLNRCRRWKEEFMARIKHIALTTKEPAKVADFYKAAFGLKELRRSPNRAVFLTDGHINVAILNYKTEKSADVGAHGPNFDGIHHFGFEVDDLDEACEKLENAQAQRLTGKDHVDATMAAGGHANFEMKWAGPDGVVIDISHTGWEGTDWRSDRHSGTAEGRGPH